MKKIFIILVVCLFVSSIILSGCSKSSSTNDSNESSKDSNGVTISLWNRWPELVPAFKKTVADFEKENPGIHVKFTTVATSQYDAQLQAAIQGNQLPDIYGYSNAFPISQLTQLDVIRNINDVITDKNKDQFIKGTWAEGFTTLNGDVYQFPLFSGYHYTYMMYYNKDLLKKYGISDIPKTWDDFMKVGNTIYQKSNGKVYGLVVGGKSTWETNGIMMSMATAISPEVFWNSGGITGINFKTGNYEFNTPGIIQSMKYFKDLQTNHVLHPNSMQSDNMQSKALFENGKAAFTWDGTFVAGELANDGFKNFDVAPLPTKEGKKSYEGFQGESPAGLVVSKNTKHYKEVKKFLNFMIDNFYKNLASNGAGEPPVPSAMEGITEPYPQYKNVMNIQDTTKILAPNPYSKNPATIQVVSDAKSNQPQESLGDILQGYLTGQVASPEDTVKEMNDKFNQALTQAIKDSSGKVSPSDFTFPDWVPFQPFSK